MTRSVPALVQAKEAEKENELLRKDVQLKVRRVASLSKPSPFHPPPSSKLSFRAGGNPGALIDAEPGPPLVFSLRAIALP